MVLDHSGTDLIGICNDFGHFGGPKKWLFGPFWTTFLVSLPMILVILEVPKSGYLTISGTGLIGILNDFGQKRGIQQDPSRPLLLDPHFGVSPMQRY